MSPVSCLVDVTTSERRKKRVRFRDELISAEDEPMVFTTTGGLSVSPRPATLPTGSSDDLRGSPDDLRGSPDDLRGSPDDLRGSPDDLRGSPDDLRGSLDDPRGSPTSYASEAEPWLVRSPLTDTWRLPQLPSTRADEDSAADATGDFSSPGWWSHKVSAVGVSAPLTVLPSVPCQDAVDIMLQEGFDQVPVVDQHGELLGIVTLRSLMTSLVVQRALPSTPVGEVMSGRLATLSREHTLLQLSQILQRHHCALVVHSQRRLTAKGQVATKEVVIGIVTPTDLLAYILRSSLSV